MKAGWWVIVTFRGHGRECGDNTQSVGEFIIFLIDVTKISDKKQLIWAYS